MTTSQINVSIDKVIKEDLDLMFKSIGMTTTEAIRTFLRQAHQRRGLPLCMDEYSEDPWQLTILDLSAEGYRNMAHALDDTEPFQKALNEHKKDYLKFIKEHDTEVRE